MTLRLYSPTVVVSVLLFALGGFASNAAGDSFYFSPNHSEIDVCTQPVYDIEVWIGSVSDIQGFSVEITYDLELHLLHVLEGDIFGGPSYLDTLLTEGPTENILGVDGACLGCSAEGPGHLFTLRFGEPWICGHSGELTFNWCLWANSNNDTTYLPGGDGTITVSCATSSGMTTWSNIKSLYH